MEFHVWAQSRGPQSARDALPLLRPRFLPLHPAHLFLFYKYESPFHPHLLLFPFYSTPHRQILYERERENFNFRRKLWPRASRLLLSSPRSFRIAGASFLSPSIYLLPWKFIRSRGVWIGGSIDRSSERTTTCEQVRPSDPLRF